MGNASWGDWLTRKCEVGRGTPHPPFRLPHPLHVRTSRSWIAWRPPALHSGRLRLPCSPHGSTQRQRAYFTLPAQNREGITELVLNNHDNASRALRRRFGSLPSLTLRSPFGQSELPQNPFASSPLLFSPLSPPLPPPPLHPLPSSVHRSSPARVYHRCPSPATPAAQQPVRGIACCPWTQPHPRCWGEGVGEGMGRRTARRFGRLQHDGTAGRLGRGGIQKRAPSPPCLTKAVLRLGGYRWRP